MTDEQEIRCRRFYYSLRDIPEVLISATHERSCYDVEKDQIILSIEDKDLHFLWATVYHELGHRQFCRYQDRLTFEIPYYESSALEEVIAEVGASVLCREAGIYDLTQKAHIEYIEWWKSVVSHKALLREVLPVVMAMMEELLGKEIYSIDIPDEIMELFQWK